MKATFSEEYYRKYWKEFLKPVPGIHYFNLESDLQERMEIYKEAELPEAAYIIIRKVEAKKLSDKANTLVRNEMDTIKRLNSGRASLGYITESQEIKAKAELVQRFEFNCLQLRDFKNKYEV